VVGTAADTFLSPRSCKSGYLRVCVDQIGDAVRQHTRLAAAGAGENQQRSLAMLNRLALGLVQAFQQLLQVLGVGVALHPSSIGAHPAGRSTRDGTTTSFCGVARCGILRGDVAGERGDRAAVVGIPGGGGLALQPDRRERPDRQTLSSRSSRGAFHGHDGLRRWWQDFTEALTRYPPRVLDSTALDGERVLSEIRSQGHFRQTGLPIDLRWASIFSFRNGKVVHAAGYLSAREALKAVGLAE